MWALSRFSQVWLCAAQRTVACQASPFMGFSSKNTAVGCHALLQRIFPTQESNLHLLCLLHRQAGSLWKSLGIITILQPKEAVFSTNEKVIPMLRAGATWKQRAWWNAAGKWEQVLSTLFACNQGGPTVKHRWAWSGGFGNTFWMNEWLSRKPLTSSSFPEDTNPSSIIVKSYWHLILHFPTRTFSSCRAPPDPVTPWQLVVFISPSWSFVTAQV